MMAIADEFADQAEKIRQLTLIAKSNSLRRSTKKTPELKTVSRQLDEKLLQMKNSI
jgi:uracil phosphoribosyltransferase